MKTVLKTVLLTGLISLSPLANAALDEKQVRNFYEQLLAQIHNEDSSFFDHFQPNATIHFAVPVSWQMGEPGKVTLEEYKYLIEETWNYTENYNFDVDKLKVVQDGEAFKVSANLLERYTMQGHTFGTTNSMEIRVVELDGKPMIAAYHSTIADAPAAVAAKPAK